nr:ribose-5-phosphate isomerase A [Clostridium sp. BNL1100]
MIFRLHVICQHCSIHGADEVDLCFNGIKGGGGALFFEKIVVTSQIL